MAQDNPTPGAVITYTNSLIDTAGIIFLFGFPVLLICHFEVTFVCVSLCILIAVFPYACLKFKVDFYEDKLVYQRRFRKDITITYDNIIRIKYWRHPWFALSDIMIEYKENNEVKKIKFSDENEILDYVNTSAPKFLNEKGINFEYYN